MTVKQLRDWLCKQDETGIVSVSTESGNEFMEFHTEFDLLVESTLVVRARKEQS